MVMALRLCRQWAAPVLAALLPVTGDCQSAGPRFTAAGKIICGNLTCAPRVGTLPNPPEFLGNQIEILKGGELGRRALERVRSMNPELREVAVVVEVALIKGTSILEVSVTGQEGKYTRIYCNALLDEFVAFRKELIQKTLPSFFVKLIDQVLAREKQVKALSDKFHEGRKAGLPAPEIERLKAELDRATEDYRDWKRALQKMEPAGLTDEVVLLERAVVAVEAR